MNVAKESSKRFVGRNIANVAAVALMLLVDNSPMILIAKRRYMKDKKYLYTMPGGSIDEGESIIEAGRRELLEETGLEVRTRDLEMVGPPFAINPSIIIQYIFCHLETSAPWQWVRNTEPDKMEPWKWMNLEEFSRLEQLRVYPDIDTTGHMDTIVEMTQNKGSLIDRYAQDDSWLSWIHEKDLLQRYGLR